MQIRTQIFPVNARIWAPFQGYGVTGVVTIFGVSPRLASRALREHGGFAPMSVFTSVPLDLLGHSQGLMDCLGEAGIMGRSGSPHLQ